MFFVRFVIETSLSKTGFSQVAPLSLAIAHLCVSVGFMNSTLNFIDSVRPRLGIVLWGLAGLEERPERDVVLRPQLAVLLAPGPRGLAPVDDGRAGLHLLVLSVGDD